METMPVHAAAAIVVRPLRESDLAEADRVMRLAFGTFLKMPDPMNFMGDADFVRGRWKADAGAAFCAVDGEVLVGSVFVGNWGSVGFFGPLTVRPDYWDKGVGRLLMGPVMECFARWGVTHAGLYTFATSMKHIGLYRSFGFWPRFLTMDMEKAVEARDGAGAAAARRGEGAGAGASAQTGDAASAQVGDAAGAGSGDAAANFAAGAVAWSWTRFSAVPAEEREAMLERCAVPSGKIYAGLDLSVDIRSVVNQRIGDTVLLYTWDELAGFAVCHYGAGSEAGSGACHIKFGCVRPGPDERLEFARLLTACEELAAQEGVEKLSGGVNLARQEAWTAMSDAGFRGVMNNVVMQLRNDPGYNHPGVYLIDDWR